MRRLGGAFLAFVVLAACTGETADPATEAPTSAQPAPPASAPSAQPSTPAPTATAAPTTDATTAAPTEPATAPAATDISRASVQLQPFAELATPTAMALRPGDTETLWFAERAGRVVPVTVDGAVGAPIVDISANVSTTSERGLLGLAWSPDGRFLYLSSNDVNGASRIDEFTTTADGIDPDSQRLVLLVEQPAGNHNGGNIAFGPDGNLWFGLGDGGAADDAFGSGQNPSQLLSTMVRINPVDPPAGPAYAIPDDNASNARHLSNEERAAYAPEVWAYGLRNPWRFSFDRGTGELWIADVGQGSTEEINHVSAGANAGLNFGWPAFEGDEAYIGEPSGPGELIAPVHVYRLRDRGCAITGGYVYRGAAIPALQGAYVFGDYCDDRVFAFDPAARREVELGITVRNAVSFGEDVNGELLVLSIHGEVFRIVPS